MMKKAGTQLFSVLRHHQSCTFHGNQYQWHMMVSKHGFHMTTSHLKKGQNGQSQVAVAKDKHKSDAAARSKTDGVILRSVCTRLLSEGLTDIENIAKEICGEVGTSCRIWFREVKFDSDSIQKKLQTLLEVGCSVNQILENPSVLRYEEKELMKRVEKIKTMEIPVNVYSIVGMHKKSCHHYKRFTDLFKGKSWVEILSEKLDCSVSELLQDVLPEMSYIFSSKYPDRTLEKIDIVLYAGFTTLQIRGCLRVLNKDVETLRKRVMLLREMGLQDCMTCSWLIQGEAKFLKIVNNAKRYSLWGDKWDYVSKLLELPEDEIRRRFKHINMTNVIPKLELLIKIGFTGPEILNRPRMMKISEKKIQKIFELMKENEMNDLDVVQRYTWVVNAIPTFNLGGVSQKNILSKLLNCPRQTLAKNAPFLKEALSRSDTSIFESIALLKSKGFSNSDIAQCPLVLNHDLSVLKAYLNDLNGRKELQPFTYWESDKIKLLNVLQYFIEKDMNFSSTGMDKEEQDEHLSEVDMLNELD